MSAPRSNRPFSVAVEAGFREDGVWYIDVRATYRDGVPAAGSVLLGRARMAALEGIAREGLRGRSLGATRVHCHLDMGDTAKDLCIGHTVCHPDGLH